MRAAIALGSNLPSRFGDPSANLREALCRLGDLGEVTAVSSLHETEPVGFTAQPRFVNAAALLRTELEPLVLLRGLLAVEQAMGRTRLADAPPKGPRIIDLDLLLFEDSAGRSVRWNEAELLLPHPEMHLRRFVLAPLAEVGPLLWHPTLQQTVQEMLGRLQP